MIEGVQNVMDILGIKHNGAYNYVSIGFSKVYDTPKPPNIKPQVEERDHLPISIALPRT